jgi:hypothetical protein
LCCAERAGFEPAWALGPPMVAIGSVEPLRTPLQGDVELCCAERAGFEPAWALGPPMVAIGSVKPLRTPLQIFRFSDQPGIFVSFSLPSGTSLAYRSDFQLMSG